MDYVLDALGNVNSFGPYSYFGVNHSGFLGGMSTVFTYLIVLMQFKQSEYSN